MTFMPRLVSLSVIVVLIIFLGITFYQVIAPFLLPLFLAGFGAVLCQPLFGYFLKRTKNRTRISAALTTATVVLAILIPLAVGTVMATSELMVLSAESDTSLPELIKKAREKLAVSKLVEKLPPWLVAESQEKAIATNIKKSLSDLSNRTFGFHTAMSLLDFMTSMIVGGMMFVIAFYYFTADGPGLIEAAEKLIPLHIDYQRKILHQFDTVVRAVVVATFLAAVCQGILTAFSMKLCGADHFFLLCVIGTLSAMIPMAGTWLVWGPYALWIGFHDQRWVAAVTLFLFGSIVIGFIDNVIRTYVLNSDARLHPLLAFVSVLGGLKVMGLWGVFVGPVVASCLHALIQIFNDELKQLAVEQTPIPALAGIAAVDSAPPSSKTEPPTPKNSNSSTEKKQNDT